ncbi:uncharacterized protein LOC131928028 isoform X2 [Physella acuta]|uniref:uncharacterized protein LOC131928028 isoform X2 n=1 Tax=Physella acuta TaxID=109671 RepID=UPI0027DBF419|nr:uncharacterized protein LOC131928028 isoform X2 [Physella acuta]
MFCESNMITVFLKVVVVFCLTVPESQGASNDDCKKAQRCLVQNYKTFFPYTEELDNLKLKPTCNAREFMAICAKRIQRNCGENKHFQGLLSPLRVSESLADHICSESGIQGISDLKTDTCAPIISRQLEIWNECDAFPNCTMPSEREKARCRLDKKQACMRKNLLEGCSLNAVDVYLNVMFIPLYETA